MRGKHTPMNDINAIPEARSAAPARAWRGSGRAVATVAMILAAGLAACDGDNLFDGSADDYTPVAIVTVPGDIEAGQILPVHVVAAAARGVSQISVGLRGAVVFDTVIDIDPPEPSVSRVIPVQIPAVLNQTSLTVTVQVIDQVGLVGPRSEAVVGASGAPVVKIVGVPATVSPGDDLSFMINATSTEPITQIDVSVDGAYDEDFTIWVASPATEVKQEVTLEIPDMVQDTSLTITATVIDAANEFGVGSHTVRLAIEPPMVSLVAPDSAWAGARMHLEVRAHALRKIAELRVELRGAVVKDTVVRFTPEQIDVTDYVAIQLPGDITVPKDEIAPQIRVRAMAMDRNNVITATLPQTVNVIVDRTVGPRDDLPVIHYVDRWANPYNADIVGGHLYDIRVSASGFRPIKEIYVRWRGFRADVLDQLAFSADTTIVLDTPRLSVLEDVMVEVPCIITDAPLLMLITVRDESDALSEIWADDVMVTGNPDCLPPPPVDEGEDPDEDPDEGASKGGVGVGISSSVSGLMGTTKPFGSMPAVPGRSYTIRAAGRRYGHGPRRRMR